MAEIRFTKDNVGSLAGSQFSLYRKMKLTKAMRVPGPFTTETREGILECPDGYLAIDSDGWPYPIAKEEFEYIYEDARDK